MKKLYNFLYGSKQLLILAGITLVVFIFSLFNRYIYIDDAWMGEQAYWFLMDGIARTETIKDFQGWDTQLFVYHKAHIIIGAMLIELFGWSVESLRLFTLAVYLLSFFVLFKFYKANQNIFPKDQLLIAAFIIFFNPLTLLYSYTFRPEILVSLLGFTSFYFIDQFIVKSPNYKYLIFAGLLAGLAFFTHLNGIIFGIAGFLVLVLMKKPRPAVIFGIFTAITASFYFYDLWQPDNFQLFLYQMKHWPDPNASNYMAGDFWDWLKLVIGKIGNEHQRFFWSYKVWGISAFFIFAMILKWKKVIKIKKHLLIYLLLLIFSLNLFGSQIAERYLLYYLPYMAIIISIMLIDLRSTSKQWLQGAAITLLLVQIVCVGTGFYDIFRQNDDYVEQHEEVFSKIPEKSAPVLVSYRFLFNALENRQLVTYKSFEYHQVELGRKLDQEEFLARAAKLNIKYIVVPHEMLARSDSRFPFLMDGELDTNPYFEPYYTGADYRIFRSIK